MRSIASAAFILIALGLTLTSGSIPAARGAQTSLDSGALGLSRADFEAEWGRGDGPFDGTGHYFDAYDIYSYGTQHGTLHVAYQDANDQEIAVYLEFAWGGDGATTRESRAIVDGLIPADARLTDVYTAPPTDEGPIAFSTQRYVSESLGRAYDGTTAPEFLVIYQERWGDPSIPDSTRVSAVSIMIRERTQTTG